MYSNPPGSYSCSSSPSPIRRDAKLVRCESAAENGTKKAPVPPPKPKLNGGASKSVEMPRRFNKPPTMAVSFDPTPQPWQTSVRRPTSSTTSVPVKRQPPNTTQGGVYNSQVSSLFDNDDDPFNERKHCGDNVLPLQYQLLLLLLYKYISLSLSACQ